MTSTDIKKGVPAPEIQQALPAKYRPRRLADLVGQSVLQQTLMSAIENGMIASGYLFTGPAGTGKTSTARILAASLSCEEGVSSEPCGVCGNCRAIAVGDHPDCLEIDAASNGGIDQVRSLIEFVATRPVRSRRKIAVLDECHQLSTAAANALLKTLEEPPPGVVFILCTTERTAVLPTIQSRCQELSFRPIGFGDLKAHLAHVAKEEGVIITESAVEELARVSRGGLRDALQLLGQLAVLGQAISAEAVWEQASAIPEPLRHSLLAALVKGDLLSGLEDLREMASRGHQAHEVLGGLRAGLRDLMLLQLVPDAEGRLECTEAGRLRIKALVGRKSYPELKAMAEVISRAMEANNSRCLRGPVLLDLALIEAVQAQPPAAMAAVAPAPAAPAASAVSEEPAPAPATAPAAPAAAEEPAGPDVWESLLAKLPEGRVREKLASAQLLNLTHDQVVVAGPASLQAIGPAAGKQLSEVLGRPVKLVRRAA